MASDALTSSEPALSGKHEEDTKVAQDVELGDRSNHRPSWTSWIFDRLNDNISQGSSTLPLSWMALLTGLIDGLLYSRTNVWVGFQTGNLVQFSMNLANYIYTNPSAKEARNPLLTTERLLSFTAFFLASFIGGIIGKRVGERKRIWLITSSLIQGIILFGGAAILLSRPREEEPTWRYYPAVIVLVAFNMGLQSILAQKLSSPVFSTSVAYTATLTQIASDPQLFKASLSFVPLPSSLSSTSRWRIRLQDKQVKGRDHRILAIIMLTLGGGIAQSLLDSSVGLKGGVAIGAACKVFLAILWCLPKGD